MSGITSKLKFVPSMITCTSAFCGTMATIFALDGEQSLVYASYFILLASLCDFSDGFAARLLHAQSELGKQLDSLADAISFGIAPTAIMYALLRQAMHLRGALISFDGVQIAVLACSAIIIICSILRLAKFNIDPEQSYGFKGLATPANALFIASIPLIQAMELEDFWLYNVLKDCISSAVDTKLMLGLIGLQVFVLDRVAWLLPLCIIFALLMITNLPMFSLKMKSYKYRNNKLVYNFLIVSALLLIVLQWVAVPIIFIMYVVVSFVRWLVNRKKTAIVEVVEH